MKGISLLGFSTKTGNLKLTEHLIQNGTLTMESDSDQFSSLIVEGNS